ncbi:MAG TPA: GGDEF domain-containing protein [Methylophilaceae bacterium]
MTTNQYLYKWLLGGLSSEYAQESVAWLVFPHAHSPILATRRASLILSRVRIISALFAILTFCWIPVDFLTLPQGTAIELAYGRMAVTLAFVLTAFSSRDSNIMGRAYSGMVLMFGVPTAFYVFSLFELVNISSNGFARSMIDIYAYLPAILIAGISIFPLTILEALLFSTPVFIGYGLGYLPNLTFMGISSQIAEIWLLCMMTVVVTVASLSQLGFMFSLMRQSMHDQLTRCYSRRSIEELLELQYIIADRSQSALSIAFIDLDNFKLVNDHYGHKAGDDVLAIAADSLLRNLRGGDMLGRWGGEEFILVFPNTPADKVESVLKRLLVDGLGQKPDGKAVTASIGVSEKITDQTWHWRELLDLADQRMYQAKIRGKNQIVTATTKS